MTDDPDLSRVGNRRWTADDGAQRTWV